MGAVTDWTTRTATTDDRDAIVRIDALTWSTTVSPGTPPTDRDPFGDRPSSDVLVAEMGGAVIGYVNVGRWNTLPSGAHSWEIQGLAVDPAVQGRGVGRGLVEAAVTEVRTRGARKVSLRVLGHNDAARRLYAAAGFTVEGVLRAEFIIDGRPVDDVLMARHLGDS